MSEDENPMQLRLALSLIGGLAGLFFWVLFEVLPDVIEAKRSLLILAVFAASFFGGMLLMSGRLGLKAAARYAVGIAVVATGLIFWSSFRFQDFSQFTETEHLFLALFLLIHLPMAFAMSQETTALGWRDYEGLFDHAWSLFVRSFTAWAFVGLFWPVLFLSDALLNLVGFGLLGDVLEKTWVSVPLTGLVLGLAMAVLNELTVVVSTLRRLALQLLRLLLPVVAAVVTLFILLVPFRGLDQVFGSLSAASTMLAMAAGAVTLITSSIDANDNESAHSRLMVLSAKILALLLPVMAAIAVYAVTVRVRQYGWTPPRLLATTISAIVFAYALAYGLALLAGPDWRTRIRKANIGVAICVMFLSGLWLTPVLNAERISANNQLARFLNGTSDVAALDVWKMGGDWGVAGEKALSRLRVVKDHPEQSILEDKLRRYDEGESRWSYQNDALSDAQKQARAKLLDMLSGVPGGKEIPETALLVLPRGLVQDIYASCELKLENGNPGCAAIVGSFLNADSGKTISLFWRGRKNGSLNVRFIEFDGPSGNYVFRRFARYLGEDKSLGPATEVLQSIQAGSFRFEPVKSRALVIDGIAIEPGR